VSWLAALAFPVGFWTRAHRVAIAALIVWGAAVLVVPQIAGLGAMGLVELGAVAAGTVIGAVLQGGRGPRGGMSLPPSSNGSSLPPHL
jgi:hypothetical protein